ncbi:kinase-like domain-containing protein [Hypoxylon rubiginosum]|uniref:Kinase-like domain-containing protein n=1 Tax=Hypoxylon rubiginosum TaxID=110542 RepID=A0ACC0CTB9_9PEZI|nr:kinase-like domain-containing protein [Hypoxylon rubiginosum]
MAPLTQLELDTLTTRIAEHLSETKYACSTLTRLTNGTTNFVFRGTLTRPVSSQFPSDDNLQGHPIETVIIKHTANFAALNKDLPIDISRCVIEASILNLLKDFPNSSFSVKIPQLYLFNQDRNIQVLQDIPGVVDLKTVVVSPTASIVLSRPLTTSIGYALGAWLRSFHSWTSARSQSSSIQIGHNEPMRKLKYLITYDAFIGNLEQFPDVLQDYKQVLNDLKLMASKEFEKTAGDGEGEEWGIIHGDFWTGNILIPETQQPTEEPRLYVVDWEFVQFGHRAYDVGQMIGDLYERQHFNDADAALLIIDAFIKGYGAVSEGMAFRIAIHAGVQLITWVVRGPPLHMRPPEAMQRAPGAMKLGMDMVLKGYWKDKKWFETGMLVGLFGGD